MKNNKLTTTLRDRTLDLLKARPVTVTLHLIAIETGLNEGWLSMFHRDKISDPSVNMVQTLYEYLTKSQIKV